RRRGVELRPRAGAPRKLARVRREPRDRDRAARPHEVQRRRRNRRAGEGRQDRFREGEEREGREDRGRRGRATQRRTTPRAVVAARADQARGLPAREIRVPGANEGERAVRFAVLLLAFVAAPAVAADPQPRVKVELSPKADAWVGQRVTLAITLSTPDFFSGVP